MTSNHLLLYRLAELMLEHEQHILPVDLLFDDEQIGDFVKSIQIDSPYQQMLFEGVLTESVREEKLFVSFTVEGYFHYVLGEVIYNLTKGKSPEALRQIIEDNKLNGAKEGVEQCLIRDVQKDDLTRLMWLIDEGDDMLELCVIPLLNSLKIKGVENTIVRLLENPTENDWIVIDKIEMELYKFQNLELRNKILEQTLKYNSFGSKIEIQVALSVLLEINESEKKKDIKKKLVNSLKLFSFDKDILLDYACYLYYIGDFKKSIYFSKKSLVLFRKDKIKYSIQINIILNNIIESYYELYNFPIAKKYLDFRIEFNSINKEYDYLSNLNSSLGIYFSKIGEYSQSNKHYKISLDYSLKLYGYYHRETAILFSNIGLNYHYENNFEVALDYYNKSLEIHKFCNPNLVEDTIYLLNNIGGLFTDMENYEKALETHLECLRIVKLKWGINNLDYANALNNIGLVYWHLDNFNKSIKYYNYALKIRINILGEKHESIANSYNNIANSYSFLNEFDKAINFLIKSIDIRNEIEGNIELSQTYEDLSHTFLLNGNYYFNLKKYELGIENFQKGYKILRKGGFPFKISQCYEALNQPNEALDYYIQSAEIRKEDIGLDEEATQEAIANSRRLAKELGKEDELPDWMK